MTFKGHRKKRRKTSHKKTTTTTKRHELTFMFQQIKRIPIDLQREREKNEITTIIPMKRNRSEVKKKKKIKRWSGDKR